MKRALLIVSLVLTAGAPAAIAEEADDAFFAAAYTACVNALKPHVKASGDAAVAFAPAEDVTMKDEDEFSISFSAGSIKNARFSAPHPVTMMEHPAGSCWGEPGVRTFSRVILNGAVLAGEPVSF